MIEKKSKMDFLWATPLYTVEFENCTNLLQQVSNVVLQEEIEISKTKIQSDSLLFNKFSLLRSEQRLIQYGSCIEEVTDAIDLHASNFLKENYPQYSNDFILTIWANIHRYADWHGTHSHYSGGNEIASGVFWVKVPNEIVEDNNLYGGKLILFDPRGPFFHERQRIVVTPVIGKLIIFPSWLQHEVTPLRCEGPRISIAFDIKRNDNIKTS